MGLTHHRVVAVAFARGCQSLSLVTPDLAPPSAQLEARPSKYGQLVLFLLLELQGGREATGLLERCRLLSFTLTARGFSQIPLVHYPRAELEGLVPLKGDQA